ncbi:Mitogen-activated protein kinase [Nowakowskiella sp. JEL0078]|nr:Mitogen-activated protein kinase [Nowakowskiella sp. JEL0078]
MKKVPFSQMYPKATPEALDLLEKLLTFDPALRITVEEALKHPYLASYHDEEDEPNHDYHFDFSFESVEGIDDMKRMIAQEVIDFKNQKMGNLNPLSRNTGPLAAPTREYIGNVPKDEDLHGGAMDLDEELRIKEGL